jgi:hypothetical protein
MNQTLWKIPVPATGLIRGPDFKVLAGRKCEIAFSIEAEDDGETWLTLRFEDVEVFKSTYLTSLGSISQDLRHQAYGAVISISESPWLRQVKQSYTDYCTSARLTPKGLQHLMITFDDGPCYEFICGAFKTV